ncbi:MAG TPA: radical SAM protein [Vicinamibacterales bacterium]|nr:radical SAM protein [Vicinamibacterales bacterium]
MIALAAIHSDPAFTPLALLYLRAQLVEHGGVPAGDVDIAEFALDTPPADIARRILRSNPRVAGLSCYVWNVTTFMEVAKLLKKARPDLVIVLGGPEVGPMAASTVDAYPDVDVVVKSEGEAPFSEIVERARDGRTLHDVKGIAFRDARGVVVDNEDAPLLKDVNDLPSPHLGGFDDIDYGGRVICLETQRGCVFKCNFCFYNKDSSVRNRRFELDRVKRELLHWLGRDVQQIYLMDPVFNLYGDRAKDILRFIAANNARRVPFHTEVWAEFIDDEMARLMRDANVTFVEVGLQTTDTTALMTVERRLKVEQFVHGVECLKKHGVDFELQLIYGLPGETRASFMKSLAFAESLEPPQLAVFPLMVLPGTELWRKAEAIGLEYEPTPPYYVRSHPTMTREDIAFGWELVERNGRPEGLPYSWESGRLTAS